MIIHRDIVVRFYGIKNLGPEVQAGNFNSSGVLEAELTHVEVGSILEQIDTDLITQYLRENTNIRCQEAQEHT